MWFTLYPRALSSSFWPSGYSWIGLPAAYTARTSLGIKTPVGDFWRLARGWVEPHWPHSVEQRAFAVFQLAQIFGLSPDVLYRLNKQEWRTILEEIDSFTGLERRRVFHLAYERRFYIQAGDAIALHCHRHAASVCQPASPPSQPRFQAIFCIDEREESIRRHIEELAPDATTFGTAGFFSVAMYYRGVADAHFVPLCPGVIRPGHWVAEQVVGTGEQAHELGRKRRRALGMASYRFNVGSRSLTAGALLTGAVGVLASIPLVARTLFPRLTSRFNRRLGRLVDSAPLTRLQLERTDEERGPEAGHVGYTVDEMAEIAEKVLREIGMTTVFSRLVFVFGHGSTSLNNPHESAHDCGACGGARGGPNARALAQMLNDPRIRQRLAAVGIVVPAATFFIGGLHNTSSEALVFYDLDLLPESHRGEFAAVRRILEEACERNCHERSRRFQSAPLSLSFAARGSTWRGGPKISRRSAPSGGTPPTRFALWAGASGRAGSSWTARVPDLVRSDPGRPRVFHPDQNSPGSFSGLRGNQSGVLLLVRG